MKNLTHCARCEKKFRGRGEWNVVVESGRMAGILCPRCQTPEENAEAVINEATTEYGVDGIGRLVGRSK